MPGNIGQSLASPLPKREHLCADVNADHGPFASHPARKFRNIEAGPATDVENVLTGLGRNRLVNQIAAALKVAA
jgi:hypothetical protein